jgi:hypothetical protein
VRLLKIIFRAVLVLSAAYVVFLVFGMGYYFWPRHGTVAKVADLRKVFDQSGPVVATALTNSLIRDFPFDGPVEWRLILFKEPMVFLNGRVNTNALRRFVADQEEGVFPWSGSRDDQQDGGRDAESWAEAIRTRMVFQSAWIVEGGYEASIHGEIDVRDWTVKFHCGGSDGPVR